MLSTPDPVRDFERIIDSEYRSLPLFTRPLDNAVYGLLAAFDAHIWTQMEVKRNLNGESLSTGQVQLLKGVSEGFVYAMRWLLDGRESVEVAPLPSESLIIEGADLLGYGANYFPIAMMYSAFSQNLMTATVDCQPKQIRFTYNRDYLKSAATWGFHVDVENENLRRTPDYLRRLAMLQAKAEREFRRAQFHHENGRLVLDAPNVLRSSAVMEYVELVCSAQQKFPLEQNLGSFTFREFNSFWNALYAWSIWATHVYLQGFDRNDPQEERMPTQVVSYERFLDVISDVAAISRQTASEIAAQLTYDQRISKADVFLRPLICGPSQVAWSCAVVQLSGFQRNLLKSMARTAGQKSLADRIIGARAVELLTRMQKWLEKKGWNVSINKKLKGESTGEIDLLAVNWHFPSEILIVEAKAVLPVDDSNEVRAATKELQTAQRQLERVIKLLSQKPEHEKSSLFPFAPWDRIKHWYGIVITPESEPGFEFDHSTFPACAFLTLQSHLRPKEWKSPSRIWAAMVDRRWQGAIREAAFDYQRIELAGICFEIPRIMFPK